MVWSVIQVILWIIGVKFFEGRVGIPTISLNFLVYSATSLLVVIIGNLVIFTKESMILQEQGVDLEDVGDEHIDKILEKEHVRKSLKHLRWMKDTILISLVIGVALYIVGI